MTVTAREEPGPASSPPDRPRVRRRNIRSLTLEELRDWCAGRDFPAYRASQIAGWLYNRPPCDLEQMHNLPAAVLDALARGGG